MRYFHGFKIGDKVICIYNEFKDDRRWDSMLIKPGMKGRIISLDSSMIEVEFDDDGDLIQVWCYPHELFRG